MLFGVNNFLHASSLLLKPWRTMVERGDATRSAAVPSEPSEAVKE